MRFNDIFAACYTFVFLPAWFIFLGMMVLTGTAQELTALESFGIGSVTGIFLAILKDISQFYYRKARSEKH